MKFGDEVIEGLKSGKKYRIVSPKYGVRCACIFLDPDCDDYNFLTYEPLNGKIYTFWMEDFDPEWLFADDWEEVE